MDKNEELQKWLNDDRYVRPKDLMILLNMSRSRVDSWLASKKIKPIKSFHQASFYDKKTCMQLAEYHFKIPRMIEEYSNDELYVESNQLMEKFGVCNALIQNILRANKIKPTRFNLKGGGTRCFYDAKNAEKAISNYLNSPKHKECQEYLANKKYITIKELSDVFNCNYNTISKAISSRHIKSVKRFIFGRFGAQTFYDRLECLRRLSDYNPQNINNFSRIQSESKKEVEETMQESEKKLEFNAEKWSNSLIDMISKDKEQSPDIIPADTIDLFTMSELESELKNRGVELTAEVRAKINASDMSEMQHIATMLRGNTKTIAIRLSVLNEIAGQLRKVVENNATDQDFERDKKAFLTAWHITCHTLNRPCKTWECMSILPLYLRQDQARRTFIHESCIRSGELAGNHKDGFCCANMTFAEKKEDENAAILIDRLDAKLCQIDSAMNQLKIESAEIRKLVAEIKLAISQQLC